MMMKCQMGDKAGNAEQLSLKPISDIKLAITLNDKLLYVKDLFNGYNLAYSEAIQILNRFDSFEEAARFLKTNYVTKNNWESKPATMEKFYALLKRRYA
jgi:CTP:phosphocholine cytidylyltransferase-like protein